MATSTDLVRERNASPDTGAVQDASADHPTDEGQGEVVLSVRNVSKKFCKNLRRSMAYGIADLGRNLAGIKPDSTTLRKDEFWALDDVSFELRRGEALGLIGVNGSGKTTLLRLIAGIFPPDKGEITVKGRVGALIAVGAGFHPHMTGRENIYLNGTILGMSREEIEERFDYIVAFAEIGDFLDAPVSTYSSGMRVRLGFAIAAHLEPEVLLVDEVLAVGDLRFKRKCAEHLNRLRSNSESAILLVSHNMLMIETLADRVAVLDSSRLAYLGNTSEGIGKYNALTLLGSKQVEMARQIVTGVRDLQDVKIVKTCFLDQNEKPSKAFSPREPVKVVMQYNSCVRLKRPVLSCRVWRDDGLPIFVERSAYYEGQLGEIIEGTGRIIIEFTPIQLKLGKYRFGITIYDDEGSQFVPYGHNRDSFFEVIDDRATGPDRNGIFTPFVKWRIE